MPIASIRHRPTGRRGSSAMIIALDGHYTSRHYPEHLRRIRLRDAESGKTLVFLSNQFGLPATTVCALYKSRWQVELFFKWIKQHLADQAVLRDIRKRGENPDLDRRLGLRPRRHRQQAPQLIDELIA